MSHVFSRSSGHLPRIAAARGVQMWDPDGKRYLDAAGGAIVVGIGHGVDEVVQAAATQARRAAYVHGTMFASETLESYATRSARCSRSTMPGCTRCPAAARRWRRR